MVTALKRWPSASPWSSSRPLYMSAVDRKQSQSVSVITESSSQCVSRHRGLAEEVLIGPNHQKEVTHRPVGEVLFLPLFVLTTLDFLC